MYNMCLLIIASVVISTVYSFAAFNPPAPLPWPEKVFVAFSQNATNPKTGEPQPFQVMMKWYDWTRQSFREECIEEGTDTAMVFLVRGKDAYVFDMSEHFCIKLQLPFGMVKRDWFVTDNKFVNYTQIEGTDAVLWEKLDHYYYSATHDLGRPLRVIAPLDQRGFVVEMNYAAFLPGKEHPSNLDVPSVCKTSSNTISDPIYQQAFAKGGRCFALPSPLTLQQQQ
jgi:hypothetical protein